VAEIIKMNSEGELSSRGAKDLLKLIPETENDARKFAEENNLLQISDRDILKKIVEEVLKEHAVAPIQFLVGQAMKKSGNKANPIILQELFIESR
jgi:Asp-tRNA(Asn)/Glu-tRNA(Gln) amidotransferase B subunit